MKRHVAVSLDTIRLKWGITELKAPNRHQEGEEVQADKREISAATHNQLKRRRSKMKRRLHGKFR